MSKLSDVIYEQSLIDCADYSNVLGNIALERLSATIGHWKGKYFAVRIKLSQRFQF